MSCRTLLVLMSLLLIPLSVSAEKAPEIEGVYERVPGQQFAFDGKEVEIIEFLSFYCGHCYQFEKSIPVIKGNFPGKLKWRTVPIYWGSGSPKPGEAYLLAEKAGKGEAMKQALFKAIFVDKKDIGNIEVLEDIGVKLGLGFDFSRRLRNGEMARGVGEAIIMSKTYHIEETPSLVIAGNLKTTPGMFKGSTDLLRDNAVTILKSLFKK